MFRRTPPSPPQEDTAVAPVEYLLDLAATRRTPVAPSRSGLLTATYALWICACVCWDDAPKWLIYEDTDGQVFWDRVPDGVEALALVHTEFSAGGHTDPGDVLAWLNGKADDPWASGDGWDDSNVVAELGRKLRRT